MNLLKSFLSKTIDDYLNDLDFDEEILEQIDVDGLSKLIISKLEDKTYSYEIIKNFSDKSCEKCYRIFGYWINKNNVILNDSEMGKIGNKILLIRDF